MVGGGGGRYAEMTRSLITSHVDFRSWDRVKRENPLCSFASYSLRTECEMASIHRFALALPEDVPERPHQPDAGYNFLNALSERKRSLTVHFSTAGF